jgi:uncharacterized protein
MLTKKFDDAHLLHVLKHYLPSQTPLKDFIHHNSLHAFQEELFFDAIFKASKIFGYQVTFNLNEYRKLYATKRISEKILDSVIKRNIHVSECKFWKEKLLNGVYEHAYAPRIGRLRANWKIKHKIDLDNEVQPLLFRLLNSYLDQGVALWHFPFEDKGLLQAIREVEKISYTSFFKSKRVRKLLFDERVTLTSLLSILVGKEEYYEQYIYDQQFAHRGWSGIVSAIESNPSSLLYKKQITLSELLVLEQLLEIDALDNLLGSNWQPLCNNDVGDPIDIFAAVPKVELNQVLSLWHQAFEWSYYDEVLQGIRQLRQPTENANGKLVVSATSFQAVFCIDERECSLRRHIEAQDPQSETLGCPGFFGVEFYFQPQHGKFYEKLCPAPVTPKYLIKEYDTKGHRKKEIYYSKASHGFFRGVLSSLSLGLWAPVKLFLNLFRPKMSPAISDAFAHMNIEGKLQIECTNPDIKENDLQLGFTIPEMATRVEALLRGIGMVKNFAPIVYIVAHGSSSANNPHHGAHDCGACSGRPGSVNARVFSFMANHPKVRELLAGNGLHIPTATQFVGALHDTASDEMAFYDEDILLFENKTLHQKNIQHFESALDMNAKERARRFASIDVNKPIKHVREAIRRRSVSFFEPRPELGHGTNALCFVGNRSLTKGLFLDRRAFMNSYDYRTDPDGKFLLNVMRPLPPVCGGINLEYYFSRVDNYKLGAGTKLPHNVMGLIGVANSSDGDLRPGLPLQMIEVHDPVRLMILVEHYPDVVLNVIQKEPALYQWFSNDWVKLTTIHPDTNTFYVFNSGSFTEYSPITDSVNEIWDVNKLIADALPMETNHIVDATKENLPVHVIK